MSRRRLSRALTPVLRLAKALLVVAVLLVGAVGCGAVHGREDAAIAATREFRLALARHDGAAACAVVAPETRRELEQLAHEACVRAVVAEEIPDGRGVVRRVDVYGDQAVVELAASGGKPGAQGDTIFLAEFPSGWKVAAAGCTQRGERPYDCIIKGT
ncbi:hypothetical protein ABN034_18645 [Actinopolymorpha sp. B11F2]|uniref:hypothetical protein n=1 Tax=Actinopolymorpha sp. B11F2 TaxID=3160862 RepID=UPI0032E3F7BF